MANRATFGSGGGRRRVGGDADLDITPMIDVTFLLLIFFMVTSTMQDAPDLQVPPARHGEGVATKNASIITILANEGEPEIYLGDGKQGSPAVAAEVTAYVAQGISNDKPNVVIKADREVASGFVEEVARAANEAEGVGKFFVGVQDTKK